VVTGCLSPESRKKGRFELTGGTNTPNDNFKLDKESKCGKSDILHVIKMSNRWL
jgi:hypothetical protein